MKRFLIASSLAIFLFFITATQTTAGVFDTIKRGLQGTGNNAGYQVTEDGAPKNDIIRSVTLYVNGMLIIVGTLFLIQLIYGGWLWMSAKGNDQQVEKGKHILAQATVAMGIIIGARIVVEIILNIYQRTVIIQ